MAGRRSFGTIRKLPSGKFQASYAHLGKRHNAPNTFLSRGDASRWLAKVEASISRGKWVDPSTVAVKPSQNEFGPYALAWVKGRKLTPRTRAHYQGLLAEMLPVFGAKPIEKIRPRQVREWFEALPCERETRNAHLYSLLRTILGTAVKDLIIETNPCTVTVSKVKPKKEVVVLSPAEVYALADAMPPRYRAMTLLTAFGCLRFGEVTELRRCDVVGGVLHIRRGVTWLDGKPVIGKPKTAAGIRKVPLLPSLRPVLAEHLLAYAQPGDDGLVFPGATGGSLSHTSLTAVLKVARTKIGQPGLTWHHLRHTGAVIWAQEPSVTLKDLMGLLGHTTPDMALHYQHVAAGKLEDVAIRLDALLKGEDGEDGTSGVLARR